MGIFCLLDSMTRTPHSYSSKSLTKMMPSPKSNLTLSLILSTLDVSDVQKKSKGKYQGGNYWSVQFQSMAINLIARPSQKLSLSCEVAKCCNVIELSKNQYFHKRIYLIPLNPLDIDPALLLHSCHWVDSTAHLGRLDSIIQIEIHDRPNFSLRLILSKAPCNSGKTCWIFSWFYFWIFFSWRSECGMTNDEKIAWRTWPCH